MQTLKRFAVYIILLIALYVVTSIIAYVYIANLYKDITNYEILSTSPEINIIESKGTYINGYILGTVKNNTGSDIEKTYLRIDLYNKAENHMGTKYLELLNFKNGETKEFKLNFKRENIASYKISIEETPTISPDDYYDNTPVYWFVGITGVIMFLYFVF